MINQNQSSKITDRHLNRKAIVYLRQSTDKQVQRNKESQRLQYALKDRAGDLGFRDIEIIDSDLGASAGVGAARREGFDRLIANVAVGEVGLILSRGISRLSRTDKDWARLLEVCQLFGTLIGDAEQIYDLNITDDQLILGIRGTLSVVELNTLKLRMLAGMEEKARRGELLKLLPPGYVDNSGKVMKSPDKRITEAITLVFRKFREIQSIRQTHLWFRNNRIELPVNKPNEQGMAIRWQLPTNAFIKDILQNPFYAGAYVWGRRQTKKVIINGHLQKKQSKINKPEQCRVFIKDHHEGYTTWETYEENRRIMSRNKLNMPKDEAVGPARAGQGILAGLLRCGHCGRKLHVRYWGKSGTAARYLCKGDFDSGGKYCLGFGGSTIDRMFSEERRAFEQYNKVDPRNRLVADELERRWNAKLEEIEKLKIKLNEIEQESRTLSKEERLEILAMGEDFPEVWESENSTPAMKKKIIRSVIEEIIVELDDETQVLTFTIHWKGGSHTRYQMLKPQAGQGQKTALEDLEIIRKMGVRYGDDEIARVLNKLDRRTGKGNRWNEHRVKTARVRYSISGQQRREEDPDLLTLGEAARYCKVSQTTIKRLVKEGVLNMEQIVPWAPWEIKRTDLDSNDICKVLKRLRKIGKLSLEWDDSGIQKSLFLNI